MVKYCVAFGCKESQRKGSGIQFHRFPFSRPEILKKWVQAIRREHWTPTAHSTICSKHFTNDSYQARPNAPVKFLKEDAVPSVFDFKGHLQKNTYVRRPLVRVEPSVNLVSMKMCKEEVRHFDILSSNAGNHDFDVKKEECSLEDGLSAIKSEGQDTLNPLFIKRESDDEAVTANEYDLINVKQENHLISETAPEVEYTLNPLFIKCEADDEIVTANEYHLIDVKQENHLICETAPEVEELNVHNEESNLDLLPGEYDNLNIKVEEGSTEFLVTHTPKTGKKGHLGIHHPHKCDICNKTFTDEGRLITHQAVHSGQRSYMCNVCNKSFSQKRNLYKHQLIHSGQRPYKCDTCNKSYTRKSDINYHHLVHCGQRPFMCDTCNKTFTKKSNLNTHQLIHNGERPFKCDICNKNFTRKGNLNTHQRAHIGHRPFKCDMCNKNFTEKSKLNRHQVIHSGQRPFTCNVCNKNFNQKDNLNKHQLIHSSHLSV